MTGFDSHLAARTLRTFKPGRIAVCRVGPNCYTRPIDDSEDFRERSQVRRAEGFCIYKLTALFATYQ